MNLKPDYSALVAGRTIFSVFSLFIPSYLVGIILRLLRKLYLRILKIKYSLFRVFVTQINFEKACEASFFKIYLGFEKAL